MAVARAFVPRLTPCPEAAAYLGVSPTTLRQLPIPRRALGAKRLYDKADLDAYADRRRIILGRVSITSGATANTTPPRVKGFTTLSGNCDCA